MDSIRDNRKRARQAIIYSIAYLIITIINAVRSIWWKYLSFTLSPGIYKRQYERDLFWRGFYGYLGLIIWIGVAITIIKWFRRAYYNTRQINPNVVSLADGWAVGSWYVPIVNLYMPFKIMCEIWKGSLQAAQTNIETRYPKALLNLWWLSYIADLGLFFFGIFWQYLNYSHSELININGDQIRIGYFIWSGMIHSFEVLNIILMIVIIMRFMKVENTLRNLIKGNAPDSIFGLYLPSYNNEQGN